MSTTSSKAPVTELFAFADRLAKNPAVTTTGFFSIFAIEGILAYHQPI